MYPKEICWDIKFSPERIRSVQCEMWMGCCLEILLAKKTVVIAGYAHGNSYKYNQMLVNILIS